MAQDIMVFIFSSETFILIFFLAVKVMNMLLLVVTTLSGLVKLLIGTVLISLLVVSGPSRTYNKTISLQDFV